MGNPDSEEHNYAIADCMLARFACDLLQFVFYTVPIRIVYNRDVKTNGDIRRYPECGEINAHAQTVYKPGLPSRAEGLGTRLVAIHNSLFERLSILRSTVRLAPAWAANAVRKALAWHT